MSPRLEREQDYLEGKTMTDWFYTTPEASLRAESMLKAFREDRIEDIGGMLAVDYEQPGTTDPFHLLVAMMSIADRLAEYAGTLHQQHEGRDIGPGVLIHEAMRVVSEAAINCLEEEDNE